MRMSTASAGAIVLVAGSVANAALLREFNAADDPAGDTVWANTGTANTGGAQNFSFGAMQTAVPISDPLAPGIIAAYDIGDTGQADGGNWSFFGQAGGGRANHAQNSFEVFFRVDDLTGQHLIMEIGGASAGLSLGLDGGTLIWAVNGGGAGADDTSAVTASVGTGWHHAVGIFDRNSMTTSLYLDGSIVNTVAIDPDTTGWTGGNEGTLGGLNTSAATTMDLASITTFDGAIAIFNYYHEELSAQTISDNYDARLVPAPASAALIGLGGLAAARRRR